MSFDKLATHYDSSVANGRFDYDHVIGRLLEHIEEDPAFVADLAAGTGNMAQAIHQQWPDAEIVCEEPSEAMIKILKQKHPYLTTYTRSLEETCVSNRDLVTIAFNSINYVEEKSLQAIFARIKAGMRPGGTFYFDALTRESAADLLDGRPSIERTADRGDVTVSSHLTLDTLSHRFVLANGEIENHTQYLVPRQTYVGSLALTGFDVLLAQPLEGTMRTEFVCRPVSG